MLKRGAKLSVYPEQAHDCPVTAGIVTECSHGPERGRHPVSRVQLGTHMNGWEDGGLAGGNVLSLIANFSTRISNC